jgi:zinc protease
MKKHFGLSSILLLLISVTLAFSQQQSYFNLNDKLPTDPKVKIGKLDNGLTYYIRENKKPEKRAELMIVVAAGSVLEDDDQDGLAHFCEHMAFNGSKNFPKSALVDFLESIGVQFGPDLNAFTNQDQTVFMIALPTDKLGLLDSGLLVLEDWAHNLSFDHQEIDKERGVILEEWRLGKGAQDRIEKKHRPFIYYSSKYDKRDVIGDTNVIKNAPYEAFTRFYKDWYRPNLMAVIAVGDFDAKDIEAKIRDQFGKIKNPENIRPKEIFPIIYHKDLLVSIATDKELDMPTVSVTMKHDETPKGTYGEYRRKLISAFAMGMLNLRYQEITRKPDIPFAQFAFAYESYLAGKTKTFTLMASSKADKIAKSTELLLQEAYRVELHGFTETEFDRVKKEIERMIEKAYDERDKTESQSYAFQYMSNFIQQEDIAGIETDLEITKKMIPGITLQEVNQYIQSLIIHDNTVITISAPEKADVVIPKENEIRDIFNSMLTANLEPYIDKVVTTPLMDKEPTPGVIKSEKKIPELDITEFTLSNGAKVVLKPTNFKNDEILFNAISPGGTSLVNDDDFYSARFAADVINESGIAGYDKDQLEKLLAGKYVSASANIGELNESISGSNSSKDIETMFQLIYLNFTKPRLDLKAYNSYTEKVKNMIRDSKNNPESVFGDSVRAISNKYHFRRMPVREQDIDKVDIGKIMSFYKDRYGDAGDFTFVFVGNFDVEKIKPFIEKYIASLPSAGRVEKWKDIGVKQPKGELSWKFNKGIEKKSTVIMTINGDYNWDASNNFIFNAMMEVFQIKLREVLREDKGGVYGVSSWEELNKYPKPEYAVNVYFGCNPDRVDELTNAVIEQVNLMKKTEPEDKYMVKVKEMLTRTHEVQLKENNYWLNKLSSYYFYDEDLSKFLEVKKRIDQLKPEDIKKAANKYLNLKNLMKFVLYPEKI